MSPHDLTIRHALAEDDRALADLNLSAWSWLSDVAPRPAADAGVFDERHDPDEYLVAEQGGRLVGFVRAVPPTPLASNQHVRQIQGLAVHPAARGNGIGEALIEAACATARTRGARRVTLRVLGHNLPARRLYERCGFTVEGICPEEFLLDGRYVDDILMGRRLDD
ncbi:GNAT family N-acetyltransferase [Kitasatospora sp. MAA4]|uniref:GNAT family N-acetyltransferase n=1 Tax=Kitasatospora sp. MAA4 TaxID=3035093 RepID=UPI0024736746|nr:GNAT family N-acetyltransferase [Kitasatospora sp. MAA4]